jgi:hypothetical protein
MTAVFLLWHISYLARPSGQRIQYLDNDGSPCATSKLEMMRNYWASAPAMPLPRPDSSLAGRCPDSATNLIASKSPCTYSTKTNGPKASLSPNEAAVE